MREKCLLMALLCPAQGTIVLFKEQFYRRGSNIFIMHYDKGCLCCYFWGDVCMGVSIGHFDDKIGRFQDAKEGVP